MAIIELGASPLRTAAEILAERPERPEPEIACPHRVWCFMNRLYNVRQLHEPAQCGREAGESIRFPLVAFDLFGPFTSLLPSSK